MNKFSAILLDTLLEIKNGKIIYLYAAITLVLLLVFGLFPSIDISGSGIPEGSLFSPEMSAEIIAFFYNSFFGFLIFLMVFGSAWLLPSYLNKGRVELILSKPINRFKLLSMKFTAVFIINAAILIIMSCLIWIVLSIRLESFSGYFFLGLLLGCIQFLAVYTIVFTIGVIGRSGALAIMGYFVIRIVTGLLASREIIYGFLGDSIWKTVLDMVYYILPKIGEMDSNYGSLITDGSIIDGFAIYTTLAFSAALYLLTLLIFHKRDY